MKPIDLRSDTVTRPTDEMRRAMAEAEVGDDVYGEDPSVNRLEAKAAELTGKEAAVFVPTGTMGNTIGIKLNTDHGQEVICDEHSHILDWELSMTAWFSGCLIRAVASDHGILRWDVIRNSLRRGTVNCAGTACIEVENTHNMAGGTVYPMEVLKEIHGEAHDAGIRVHMDAARLFNASVASGVAAREIAAQADTVMFCLSKGLGAPAGSMIAGSAQDMEKARLHRKRLGGGMRQAGVLAAAGLVSLEKMVSRLADDHANAAALASALSRVDGFSVMKPETNIVRVDVSGTGLTTADLLPRFKREGVLLSSINPTTLRALTHYDVSRADCDRAAEIVAGVMAKDGSAIARA